MPIPEFLNRLDEIITFNSLTLEDLKKIVKIQIGEVEKRLKGREIKLNVSSDAMFYLAQKGFNPKYGARPLKRFIQNKILNSVAELIISGKIASGDTVAVKMKNNDLSIEGIAKKRKKTTVKKKIKEKLSTSK